MIAVGIVAAGVIGTPIIVSTANAARQEQTMQLTAAQDATAITRAAGERDTVLAGSAVQAGVIAQQEAAAKAAAQAAQAAAEAADAQKAAQEAAAQQTTQTQQSSTVQTASVSTPTDTTSPSAGLPVGAVVPDIPGTTSPDTTKCASGRASTVNGVPVCD